MRAAAAAQEFERAAVVRNRLAAVRHLMERQFATPDSVGTADVLGIAHRGRLGQRAGAAGARRRAAGPPVVLPRRRPATRTRTTVLVQFAYEFYSMALAIPPLVVVAQESGARRGARDAADRAARQRRRGARGGARRQAQAGRAGRAQRPLRPRPGPPPPRAGARAPPRGAGRPPGHAGPARRRRRASSAYDISNLGETYAVASMVVFEGGAPAKATTAPSRCATTAGRTTSRACREAVRRRFARLAEPGEDDPSFAARPGLVVIDGGKGQLSARPGGHARRRGRRRPGREPGQAPRGGVPPRAVPDPLLLPEGSAAPAACCSTSATRRTASRCATTAAGAGAG